jgi:hypothetical protein
MGDRVLMQCHSKRSGKFGPIVYGHWLGDRAKHIVTQLTERMSTRRGDVDYASARLVQECCLAAGQVQYNTGVGMWNASGLLGLDDSHGDAGCVLIDVDDFSVAYFGGYLRDDGSTMTYSEQQAESFYAVLGANG